MCGESVSSVGLSGTSSPSTSLKAVLTPRSAFERVKEIVQSQQFQDGLKIFAIGAAVSASKSIADAILATIKRIFLANATFRGRDEAYRWILLFMTTHPNFQKSPRAVEVSARPSLLIDADAEARGLISEGEIRSSWSAVQDKDIDSLEDGDSIRQAQHEKEQQEEMRAQSGNNSGYHFFPAVEEKLHFVFEGTHFWASRQRQLVGDGSWDETINISFLSLSSNPLRRLIKHIRQQFQEHSRGRVTINRVDKFGNWISSSGLPKRSVESVHLPGSTKMDVLDDAKKYFSSQTRQWYNDRGIPYRRGYLFHGPPGSGKSSLCHVLASEIEQPIYVLNLSSNAMSDADFLEKMSDIPSRSIVLMEDIDAAFVQRESSDDQGRGKTSSVSFSALLNAIDGVGAAEGRLLCVTTNHIERLDKALIRPGRIDRRFEFGNATQEQARQLFLRWYAPTQGTSPQIEEQAQAFAREVPPNHVSVASLQGFLLGCIDDPHKAIQEVAAWCQDQEGT